MFAQTDWKVDLFCDATVASLPWVSIEKGVYIRFSPLEPQHAPYVSRIIALAAETFNLPITFYLRTLDEVIPPAWSEYSLVVWKADIVVVRATMDGIMVVETFQKADRDSLKGIFISFVNSLNLSAYIRLA